MNLALTLLYAAERDGAREAVVDGDTRLTYASLHEHARRLAGGLAELGVGRGDRVAALLKNRVETVTLYWAAQWLGAMLPLTYFLQVLRGILLKAAGPEAIWRQALVLTGFSFGVAAIAVGRFRKKLE